MKKVLFFLLAVMLSLPLTMKAQETLTVNDGTATSSYVPVYGFYADAYLKCEYILPATDLSDMAGGTITQMTFYTSSSASSQWGSANFQVFLKEVTETTISSYFGTAGATVVYTGSLDGTGSTMEVEFDTPYQYGGGNLLVGFYNTSEGTYSSAYFYGVSASNSCIQGYSYSDLSSVTQNGRSFLPKTTFTYELAGGCPMVRMLAVNDVDDQSATLTWQDTVAYSWDIYYTDIATDVPDSTTVPTATVTTTTYDLAGLTSSTHYYAYVRANCGSDVSRWKAISFLTSQVAAQLPYTQDFEDATENANWTITVNGANQWVIDTAVNTTPEGQYSLYVSNDYGVSNSYTISSATATSWAYRDIDFGNNYAEYAISFSWRCQGESGSYDYLKVFIGSPATPPTSWSYSSSLTGATFLGTYQGNSSWNTANIFLPSTYTGVQRLYFLWWNDGSGGSNPPAAVDNISVTGSNCGRPTAVALDGTTPSSIAFHFVPALETDYAWQAVVVPAGSVIDPTMAVDLSDTMHVFTDLLANTAYNIYVRTDCGSEYSNWSDVLSVRTDCDEYTLPYTENFDSYTSGRPTCWYYTNSSYPSINSSVSSSPSNSLYFGYNSNGYCAAMPAVPLTDSLGDNINLSDLRLRFNAKLPYSGYSITVGVMTDPSDMSTYTALQTISPTSTSSFEPQEVFFINYTGTGRYIAFQCSTGYMYIDDIVLDYAPTCSEVTHLEVSSIAGTSAMLTWEDGTVGTTTGYGVEYTEYGQENWVSAGTGITNTYFLLSGLTAQTHYEVRVIANCEDGSSSVYTTEDFTTICMAGGDIQYGDGGSNNSYLPANSCYNYAMSEQLFTASELGGSNVFSSISFQVASVASATRNWDIYLMPTTEVSLSSVVAVDTTVAVKVFSGNASFATGWSTINFTTPFQYDGQSNLILIVDDNTGSYNCSNYFYYHSNPNGSSYYCYNDSYNADPLDPSSFSGTFYTNSNRANVIFGGNCDSSATCIAPNMFVNNITYNSADVFWAAGYQESAWEMEYKEHSDSTWAPVASPTGFNATITGLASQTSYDVRMRSDCGGEYSDWTLRTFTTECGPIEVLPYSNNFETYTSIDGSDYVECWYRYTNDPSHYVYVMSGQGTTPGVSNNHCLDFHHTPAPTNVIAILPQMGSSINVADLMASFYLTMTENMSTAIMEIGVMTDPNDATTFEVVDTITMTNQTWTYVTAPLTNYTGTGSYIAFRVSNGTGHGFRMDDITIDYTPSCLGPQYVSASNITMTDADIAWTEMGDATSWNVEYGPHGFTPGQGEGTEVNNTTNPTTITGLTPATLYDVYVTSNCGGGEVSNYSPVYSFGTLLCDSADKCNYTINLTDGFGDGWNGAYITVYTNGIQVTTVTLGNGSSGTATVSLCDQTTTSLAWNSGNYDSEISFTFTDPFGEVLFTCNENQANLWTSGQVIYTETANCTPATCPRPSEIHLVSTTLSTLEVGWTEMGTATSWNIEYGPAGFEFGEGTMETGVTTNPYTLSGLSDTVQYDVYVQADCGGGDVSEWRGPLTTYTGVYTMSATGTDTVTMCGGVIYDDGGANGNYSNNCNAYLVVNPETSAQLVSISGTLTAESSNWDYLIIYDGDGVTELYHSSQSSGTPVTFGPIESTTGPLTVYFHSDASGNYEGFALNVSCVVAPTCKKPVNLTASAATTSSIDLAWTEMGTATTWNIEYGPAGFTQGTGTIATATTNPYTLTGLTAATTYDVYVQADCGGGDVSDWSSVVTAATLPCDDGCIYTVNMSDQYGDGWNGAYITVTTSLGTQTVTLSDASTGSANVILCPGDSMHLSWNSGNYDDECSFTVEDASGTVLYTCTDASSLSSGTFFSASCGDVPPTGCNVPTALAVSNITNSSASINWTAGGTETAWNLQYKKASQSTWSNSIAVTARPYTLSNLDAETAYQVRVQANCGAGSTSDWTTAQNFTTAAAPVDPCNAPTNLQVTGTTANTATITWTAGGTETAWKVQYKLHTASEWSEATASTTTYTINGLTAATAYDVQVYAICSATAISDPTAVVNFTTAGTGISNVELANSISIMPNPAESYIELSINSNVNVKEAAIYNAFGQLVQMVTLTDNHVRIDVSGMAAGMYFVRIANDSNMATKKFIKR